MCLLGWETAGVPIAFSLYFWSCYNRYCFLLACGPRLKTDRHPIAFHIKSHQSRFRYCLLPLRPCNADQSNTWMSAQLNTRYKEVELVNHRTRRKDHWVHKESLPSQDPRKPCGNSERMEKQTKKHRQYQSPPDIVLKRCTGKSWALQMVFSSSSC